MRWHVLGMRRSRGHFRIQSRVVEAERRVNRIVECMDEVVQCPGMALVLAKDALGDRGDTHVRAVVTLAARYPEQGDGVQTRSLQVIRIGA